MMPHKLSLLALVTYLAIHGAASPQQLMMVRGLDYKRQTSNDRRVIDCPAGTPAGATCYAGEECPAGENCVPIVGGGAGGDQAGGSNSIPAADSNGVPAAGSNGVPAAGSNGDPAATSDNNQVCPGGVPKDPRTRQCPKPAASDPCPGGVPKDPKTGQCPKPAGSGLGQAAGTGADQGASNGTDQGAGSNGNPATSSNPVAGAGGASGASSNQDLSGGETLPKCLSQNMQAGDGTIACTLKDNQCPGYNDQLKEIKELGGNEQVYAVASLENSQGNCGKQTVQVPTDPVATKQSATDGSRNCGPFNQNIAGIKKYCKKYASMDDNSICEAFKDNAAAVKCVLETTQNIGWLAFSQMHRCGEVCDNTPDGGMCGPKPALRCKAAGLQYLGGVNHVAQVILDIPGQNTVGGVFLDPI